MSRGDTYEQRVAIGYLAVAVVLLTIQTKKAFSQEDRAIPSRNDSALAMILGTAPERSRLRIHIRNGLHVDDPQPRLANDSVIIRFHRSTQVVALSEIDSVWVQRETAAVLVGAIAAVPCAIYGALLFHLIATDPDGGRPGDGLKGAIYGAVLGTVLCGLPGAALGSWIKRWRLIYPVPARR